VYCEKIPAARSSTIVQFLDHWMLMEIVTVCVMAEAPEPEVAVTTTVLVPELA
jgi:hypothetical protein